MIRARMASAVHMGARSVYVDRDRITAEELSDLPPDSLLCLKETVDIESARVQDANVRWFPDWRDGGLLSETMAALRPVLCESQFDSHEGDLLAAIRYEVLYAVVPLVQRMRVVRGLADDGIREVTWIGGPKEDLGRAFRQWVDRDAPIEVRVASIERVASEGRWQWRLGARDLAYRVREWSLALADQLPGLRATTSGGESEMVCTEYFTNSVKASLPVVRELRRNGILVSWLAARREVERRLSALGESAHVLGDPSSLRLALPYLKAIPSAYRTVVHEAERRSDVVAQAVLLLRRRVLVALRRAATWLSLYEGTLSRRRPKVLFSTTYSSTPGRAAALAARRLGIASAYLQHGVMPEETAHADFVHQHALVWGRRLADFLSREASGLEPFVVGPLPYDDLVARASRNSRSGNGSKQVAYMASRSGGAAMSAATARRTVEAIARAVGDIPNAHLVVKLHPGDRTQVVQEALRPYPSVTLMSSGDSRQVVLESDLVLVYSSTTGLEACLADKPLIVVNLTRSKDFMDYAVFGAALEVREEGQLLPSMRAALELPETREGLREGRRRLADALLNGARGDSVELAAQRLSEIANEC
jgi:hypothetical protein